VVRWLGIIKPARRNEALDHHNPPCGATGESVDYNGDNGEATGIIRFSCGPQVQLRDERTESLSIRIDRFLLRIARTFSKEGTGGDEEAV